MFSVLQIPGKHWWLSTQWCETGVGGHAHGGGNDESAQLKF